MLHGVRGYHTPDGHGRVGGSRPCALPAEPASCPVSHRITDVKGMVTTMDLLRRNYDLVATVGTGATFVTLGAPWWLWSAYGVMVTFQIGNRVVRGWSR